SELGRFVAGRGAQERVAHFALPAAAVQGRPPARARRRRFCICTLNRKYRPVTGSPGAALLPAFPPSFNGDRATPRGGGPGEGGPRRGPPLHRPARRRPCGGLERFARGTKSRQFVTQTGRTWRSCVAP